MSGATFQVGPTAEDAAIVLKGFSDALTHIEGVRRSEEANTGSYTIKYASLSAVLAEAKRCLAESSMSLSQVPTVEDGHLAIKTMLIDEKGRYIIFDPIVFPLPRDPQAIGSAITYGRRYALVTIFGMPVDDDDGRTATEQARAAQTSVDDGARTPSERAIRAIAATMDRPERDRFVTDFKSEFGVALMDLPVDRHPHALLFARRWVPAPVEADLDYALPGQEEGSE